MKPDIYPVKKIKNGSLSVMAKPVSGEWIEDEFAGIASYGINILVSLLEKEESKELGLKNEQKHCHKNDINFISYPIKDRGVPNSVTHFVKLIQYLFDEINLGKSIVIHCRAGIGRTGIVAAGVLVKAGMKPDDAFELISHKRRIKVPDTEEQREWLLSSCKAIQRD